ncbi:MAG TPA: hypothetical protein VGM84_26805 [Steroidobacteraceae bacterium]|jgi:hypothetical protein
MAKRIRAVMWMVGAFVAMSLALLGLFVAVNPYPIDAFCGTLPATITPQALAAQARRKGLTPRTLDTREVVVIDPRQHFTHTVCHVKFANDAMVGWTVTH